MPEIRGSVTAPPKPLPRVFGPRDDTHSFSNRGRESRRVVLPPSSKSPQDLGKQRKTPVPSISKQPVQPAPGIIKQPSMPAPGVGKGSPQIRPFRESVQPPRAPSVTFGGYRGDNEARSQSLRGKTSRQSSEGMHPSAPMSKGRDPADKSDVRGRTPAGKDDIRGKMRQ
jgi:hypothetical protein